MGVIAEAEEEAEAEAEADADAYAPQDLEGTFAATKGQASRPAGMYRERVLVSSSHGRVGGTR